MKTSLLALLLSLTAINVQCAGPDFTSAPGSPFLARDGQKPHTHGLASGDVNGDGKLDLVTANNDDNDVSVLPGDGRGGFARAPGSPFPVGPSPHPFALADVNGDKNLDINAPNSGPNHHSITVLLGDGRGGFRAAPKSPFRTVASVYFICAADFNGDRKLDIATSNVDSDDISILLGR